MINVKNTIIVVEQKGSDRVECTERILTGKKILHSLLRNNVNATLIIVGGANKGMTSDSIKQIFNKKDRLNLRIDRTAANTKEKAITIASYFNKYNTQDSQLILVSSTYHLLRAYLTLVKTLNDSNLHSVKITNTPADFNKVGFIKVAKYGMGELKRLLLYSKKRDLTIHPKSIISFFTSLKTI